MNNIQLSLFDIKNEEENVADIRTEKQLNNKLSYDVGEEIANSRKSMASLRKAFEECQTQENLDKIELFNEGLADEIITKAELTKNFSVDNEIENGVEPAVIRFKQLLLQRVENKPTKNSKEGRKAYLKAVQYLLESLDDVIVWDDIYNFCRKFGSLIRYEKQDIPFLLNCIDKYKNELARLNEVSKDYKLAEEKLNQYISLLEKAKYAKEFQLSCLGKQFVNFFRNSASYKSTLTNSLKVDTYEKLLTPQRRKKTKRKPVWERRLPERPDRIGGAQSPIEKPEDLVTFFGYRGVQFGHYVSDSKAQEHLLRSSEAMMDLAELLNLDYKALSLNGSLAIAYGARGRGSALAHYEPVEKVINLTKERGSLGVFAHEFFHALDHHLFNLSHGTENKLGYASNFETLGNCFPKLISIFKKLESTMKKGKSIAYIVNTNKPGDSWRGNFKKLYEQLNGDLFKIMEVYCNSVQQSLETRIKMAQYLGNNTDKVVEKGKKQMERKIKRYALALAWYHEVQTGERIEKIPYPSDKTAYYQVSIELDKGNVGKYWSSNIEMAARAFEAFIQDKLTDMGRKSDYLVAGTRDATAYPTKDERLKLNTVFEELVQLIGELNLL